MSVSPFYWLEMIGIYGILYSKSEHLQSVRCVMKNRLMQAFFLFTTILFYGCYPFSGVDVTESSFGEQKTYSQDFVSDIAWIPVEWNGKLIHSSGYGSGFLVNKDEGLFFTNKHVSDVFDSLGQGSQQIFFNGVVYSAKFERALQLVDTALVRIDETFNSSDFPDPLPFATEELMIGDKVFVEGFHPHPYMIRLSDKNDGIEFPLLSIFKDYYRMGTIHLEREREVVFEKLEAEVTELDKKISINNGERYSLVQDLRNRTNLYVEIRTLKDHKFSFGGLSGTRVVNENNEIVGIFAAGPTMEIDPDTVQELPGGARISEIVHKTAYIIPIQYVEELMQ
jgi:hypothetical protein